MAILINWDSIMTKCQASVNSDNMQNDIDKKIKNIMFGIDTKAGGYNLYEVGEKFADVLWSHISGTGLLPPGVINALDNIIVIDPVDNGDGTFSITVTWGVDLDRSSMSTHKNYGYDINIASLYNNGVDHIMRQILETTPDGVVRRSLTHIPSTNFIENAMKDFMTQYGKKYHVISIHSSLDD